MTPTPPLFKKRPSDKSKKIKHRIEDLQLPVEKKKIQAIALKYDFKKSKAPRIVALGKGAMAEKILELAEEHKIPFYEDQSLTDLLAKLDIDTDIPPELYTLVAEVLAFVYQLDKLNKKRRKKR